MFQEKRALGLAVWHGEGEGGGEGTAARCHVKLLVLPPSVQKHVMAARLLGHGGIREEKKWGKPGLVRKLGLNYLSKE